MTAILAQTSRATSTLALAVAGLLLLTLPASDANATSFDSFAEASLQFDSLEGIQIKFSQERNVTPFTTSGASSSSEGMVSDDGLAVETSVFGETIRAGSNTTIDSISFSLLELTNTTGSDLRVEFTFEFDISATYAVTDIDADSVGASATINLLGGGINETLSIDLTSERGDPENNFNFGSVPLTLVLPSAEPVFLDLETYASGFATTTAVPLPPAIWMMLGAVTGLATLRRRRPQTAP